ncbi:hypothetical protein [Bradyrhizobium canariense]|uniref:Uncharacterized protein n=1 Tax=Bradyrhizobium canariense TaxID=255045 RepID=A0A1H2AGI3_9BRAD|nr:hypothetical protein [Bradyrhizobium canariense]SDT44929.1 hypothetical protein SAMN05444158_6137 [Bradyrhizobium canariense]
MRGDGYLCTPLGERYRLQLRGGTPGRVWSDMDRHAFRLRAYYRPVFWNFTGQIEQPPRLTFAGRWSGPDLTMTDEGSFDRAFAPDGSLNLHPSGRRVAGGVVPVTFTESAWWFGPSCPAAEG